MDTSSSFSSPFTMLFTFEACVIPTKPKMPFLIKGFGDSEGGSKKTLR